MEQKGRLSMTREDVGRLLKKLGEELLTAGRVAYPSEFGVTRDISMPERLYVEVEYKEKRDRKKFEIEIEW